MGMGPTAKGPGPIHAFIGNLSTSSSDDSLTRESQVSAFPGCGGRLTLSQFNATMETGQRVELDHLRLKADEVLNESVERTRRINEMCQVARQMATGVLVNLDGEGGQFWTSN